MKNWKFMTFGIALAAVGFFAAPSTSEAQKGGGGGRGGPGVSGGRGSVGPARGPAINNSGYRGNINNFNNGNRSNNGYYGNGFNNGFNNGYYNGYYGSGLGIGVGGVYLGLGGANYGLYGNRYYGGGYNNGYYNGGTPIYDGGAPSIVVGQPATNSYQSFYPSDAVNSAPSNDANRGTVVVMVPDNAELFWGGSRSTLTGTSRTFSTLPLSADGSMQTFEARWTGPDGKAVTRTREIRAMPNTSVVLDFTKPGNDRN